MCPKNEKYQWGRLTPITPRRLASAYLVLKRKGEGTVNYGLLELRDNNENEHFNLLGLS